MLATIQMGFRKHSPSSIEADSAAGPSLDTPPASLKSELHRICGVDLTTIPGIKEQAAQIIISEVGLDMTRWNIEKQFASFLGLCPNNSIIGGKVLRRSTRKLIIEPPAHRGFASLTVLSVDNSTSIGFLSWLTVHCKYSS